MSFRTLALAVVASATACLLHTMNAHAGDLAAADPNLWLEEVGGDAQLAWVREQNAASCAAITTAPGFQTLQERLLTIFNSKEKIPYVRRYGEYLYNFWKDATHVRGLWRRTTLDEYRKSEPTWETVLDIDELCRREGETWVWKGADVLELSYDRAMLLLSRGGADAVVAREFDLVEKRFVAAGFTVPEAKTKLSWSDRDTLWVSTDFGSGTLTASGYPRITKVWRRGTPLSEAHVLSEGRPDDVYAASFVIRDRGLRHEVFRRDMTFFTDEYAIRRDGAWVVLPKPADASIHLFGGRSLLSLKTDWSVGGVTHRAGTLLAIDLEAWLAGGQTFDVLFSPTERTALEGFAATQHVLVLRILDNVRHRLEALEPEGSSWRRRALETPEFAVLEVDEVDAESSDDIWIEASNLVTPTRLLLGNARSGAMEPLKSMPSFFDASGLAITQHEATSRDGTHVPYFQVARTGVALDGSHPTYLYGYGGFEVSELPAYRSALGAAWLERGGVAVIANIRGGGEFGPTWHNAARRENRQRAYDDFIAVAEDLVARGVTSPKHLGVNGGSNGGLLTGVMLTQRPDLFGAVSSAVPLLDMRRYHLLLAGASWMDEYGNPDAPGDWEFIRRYSPYHNVKSAVSYPPVLFTTSTRDDRVHPGHARKMHALLRSMGQPSFLYENIEGGHGGAATNAQYAFMQALTYTFLWQNLAD